MDVILAVLMLIWGGYVIDRFTAGRRISLKGVLSVLIVAAVAGVVGSGIWLTLKIMGDTPL